MYDIVAHAATEKAIKSHRHISVTAQKRTMPSAASKLKALRERVEPKMTVRHMAQLLGMPPSTYAAYEDEKKFKKPVLPLQLAKSIAANLAAFNIEPNEVLALAGVDGHQYFIKTPNERIWVRGAVAAGVWREQAEWPRDEHYEIEVAANPFPRAERFALRMEGLSMNRTMPPGSDLECLRVAFGSVDPRPGDLVIVERTNHDLTEMTCKRLDVIEGEWVLRCESYEPEFQDYIPIGRPDPSHHLDTEIRIVGIVLSAQRNFTRFRN